jgi:hypothetical protein
MRRLWLGGRMQLREPMLLLRRLRLRTLVLRMMIRR